MTGPFVIVYEEWTTGDSHADPVALFTGDDALTRAWTFAKSHEGELAASGFNVYGITSADDYEGELDPSDWDVDVHVDTLTRIDPDQVAAGAANG